MEDVAIGAAASTIPGNSDSEAVGVDANSTAQFQHGNAMVSELLQFQVNTTSALTCSEELSNDMSCACEDASRAVRVSS